MTVEAIFIFYLINRHGNICIYVFCIVRISAREKNKYYDTKPANRQGKSQILI